MDIHARVARLERRNRVLTCVTAVLAVAAPLGFALPRLGAADGSQSSAVDVAERLVLRGANGTVAATLVSTPTGANLSLCDAAGKPRLVFNVGKDGPNVVFLDGKQSSANKGVRLALSASEKSGPSLSLFGENSSLPLASVRTKPGAGSASATGAFMAVNEENKPVVFPRSGKSTDAEESAGPSAAAKGR